MAIPTNATIASAGKGIREDLENIIFNISP